MMGACPSPTVLFLLTKANKGTHHTKEESDKGATRSPQPSFVNFGHSGGHRLVKNTEHKPDERRDKHHQNVY